MGEFSSTVTTARPRSTSLRTTIPEGIAKLIDLKPGDELKWIITLKAKGVDVTVSKK